MCLGSDNSKICSAKMIRRVFQQSEQGKIRRPGDIFYALGAIETFVFNEKTRMKFVGSGPGFKKNDGKIYYSWSDPKSKYYDGPLKEVNSEAKCTPWLIEYSDNEYLCADYNRKIKKKIEKFKKDPSNEKILGRELIKHIHNVRMIIDIREKIGIINYSLIGDMLNASVLEVKKSTISPDLKLRRNLLKKYFLLLGQIKQKLDEEKYKSIEKDISKLSKNFSKLKKLKSNSNKISINIDKAIHIIFDLNNIIENSSLKAKDSNGDKILALASIDLMQSMIDEILITIPVKYYAITKDLDPNLFSNEDLNELGIIINEMLEKTAKNKSEKFTRNSNIIDKHVDLKNILNKLEELGIRSIINSDLTVSTTTKIANEQIRNNLNNKIFKDIKKTVQKMDIDKMSEISKEISNITSEIKSDPTFDNNVTSSNSYLTEFGHGVHLKALIHQSRQR